MRIETPTYESLVDLTQSMCRSRLKELKLAEPLLREIAADIEAITAAGIHLQWKWGFDVRDGRTHEEIDRGARRKPSLRLVVANVFISTREKNQQRLADLLLNRGWTVLHGRAISTFDGWLILGKKGVRARLDLSVPRAWLTAREMSEPPSTATTTTDRQSADATFFAQAKKPPSEETST